METEKKSDRYLRLGHQDELTAKSLKDAGEHAMAQRFFQSRDAMLDEAIAALEKRD